ncbi:MAG: FAD binding domain-containing protein [Desulfopila sp.]
MARVYDGMVPFTLYRPAHLEDALALAERFADAWILAGGFDSLERFKDRLRRPAAVIDLGGIERLKGVRREAGELVIGAMTTLADVGRHPEIQQHFSLLSRAAEEVASPQIRNRGTLGGNICQDARCWYYRGGWDCYRAGGGTCYAAENEEGQNREHAIFGIAGCAAVSPSDTAPVLVALDARLTLEKATGARTMAAEEFFVGPDDDISRLTLLSPGEILTEIRLPMSWADATFYFEKVRDRPVWDFALANIASALKCSGDRIDAARLVLGGVAARPWRLAEVEAFVTGQTAKMAADAAAERAVKGATALPHNGYKVILARNLVRRALLAADKTALEG